MVVVMVIVEKMVSVVVKGGCGGVAHEVDSGHLGGGREALAALAKATAGGIAPSARQFHTRLSRL